MIIPERLFDGRKTFSVRLPRSSENEKFSKVFTRKVENFSKNSKNHMEYTKYTILILIIKIK